MLIAGLTCSLTSRPPGLIAVERDTEMRPTLRQPPHIECSPDNSNGIREARLNGGQCIKRAFNEDDPRRLLHRLKVEPAGRVRLNPTPGHGESIEQRFMSALIHARLPELERPP